MRSRSGLERKLKKDYSLSEQVATFLLPLLPRFRSRTPAGTPPVRKMRKGEKGRET